MAGKRDFEWTDNLWAVVKADGTFAGVPCTSCEEARELANQHEGSHVYGLCIDFDDDVERYPEDYPELDFNEDFGFDPYMGCYTDDC